MDHPAIVHDVNMLTVVASESFKEFVTALQKDIQRLCLPALGGLQPYFTGKVLKTPTGNVEVTPQLAKDLQVPAQNDYSDDTMTASRAIYHEAKRKAPWHRCPGTAGSC